LLSTIAASAAVGAKHTGSLSPHHKQQHLFNYNYNYNYIQYKHFSDGAPKLNTDQHSEESTETSEEQTLSTFELMIRDRPPSILTTSFPNAAEEPYTTGQAWYVLQNHIAGGFQIRHEDVTALCNSVQPQSPKDSKLVQKVLLDLKRCNRFILSKELAGVSAKAMARGLLPSGGVDEATPYYKVQCGLFIGNAFLNKNTGLYVSLDTDVLVDTALNTLYSGLDGLRKEDNEKYEEQRKELLAEGRAISKTIFRYLLTRASTPTRNMKKRAKRKYLKCVRCCSGPSPQSIDVLVRICLLEEEELQKGLNAAFYIMNTYGKNAFLGKAMDETFAAVKEAEEKLAAQLQEENQGESDEGDDPEGEKDGEEK